MNLIFLITKIHVFNLSSNVNNFEQNNVSWNYDKSQNLKFDIQEFNFKTIIVWKNCEQVCKKNKRIKINKLFYYYHQIPSIRNNIIEAWY